MNIREAYRTFLLNAYGIWYYIKCMILPWRRYNRIHVKTLPPTWHDRDTLLAHTMFQILDDFVREECSPGIIDWDSNIEHKTARREMDELLDWWHNTYLKFDEQQFEGLTPPKDLKIFDCDLGCYKPSPEHKTYYGELNRREKSMESQLQYRLQELLRLRKYMWT